MANPVLAAAHLQGHLINHKQTDRCCEKTHNFNSRNQPGLAVLPVSMEGLYQGYQGEGW